MCFGLSAYCMSPKSQIRKSTEECRIFSNFDLTSDTLYSPLCISYLCKWGGVGSTVSSSNWRSERDTLEHMCSPMLLGSS